MMNTQVWKSIGSSVESQLACRKIDGVFFVRYREKDARFGWHWTAWKQTDARPYLKHNGDDPASYSETCSGWIPQDDVSVRLPKV